MKLVDKIQMILTPDNNHPHTLPWWNPSQNLTLKIETVNLANYTHILADDVFKQPSRTLHVTSFDGVSFLEEER